MTDRYREILVVDLLGGIGDLLMLLPAVHGLARRNSGSALRVVTHDPGADLIRGDPAVTEVRTPRHGGPLAAREAVVDAIAARRRTSRSATGICASCTPRACWPRRTWGPRRGCGCTRPNWPTGKPWSPDVCHRARGGRPSYSSRKRGWR